MALCTATGGGGRRVDNVDGSSRGEQPDAHNNPGNQNRLSFEYSLESCLILVSTKDKKEMSPRVSSAEFYSLILRTRICLQVPNSSVQSKGQVGMKFTTAQNYEYIDEEGDNIYLFMPVKLVCSRVPQQGWIFSKLSSSLPYIFYIQTSA